jgi:hypothetical protein
MYKEMNDSVEDFVRVKMKEIDSFIYSDNEMDTLFRQEHKIIVCEEDNMFISFCTLIRHLDGYKMCYTWCDGTMAGKKSYAKGLDYVISTYKNIYFGNGGANINKVKRIIK